MKCKIRFLASKHLSDYKIKEIMVWEVKCISNTRNRVFPYLQTPVLRYYIEHHFFDQYNGPKSELYRRYIDACIGATSSSREDLNQFIAAVNLFHPALKYTWEISDTSLAFLDIKVSIEGNGLCTSVHYKPTDCCIHLHIHHMSRIPFLIYYIFSVSQISPSL